MREYAFELALCAHLESTESFLARQLGAAVHGRRVVDVVRVEPGSAFDERAAITPATIPPLAIEADVGTGVARPIREAFECHPERARSVVERAVEAGFFERERRGARTVVRQTTRYPDDWFGDVVGIENKPDLGRPGDLETQLLTDVHLGLLDRVVLATASHVTGAHLNRIPEPVGVWQFDPETGEREVVRAADALDTDAAGVEILERRPARASIRIATRPEIERARRRLAERAYGKGWRPTDLPECANCEPTDDGRPYCSWAERVVEPAVACGSDCDGHDPAPAPTVAADRLRDRRTAWVADPPGRDRRQVGIDRFGPD